MQKELFARYPALAGCEAEITAVRDMMLDTYYAGGKILVCGNGGSAADCDHIAGELLKGFLSRRPMDEDTEESFRETLGEEAEPFIQKLQGGIPVISLPAQAAALTAFANDVDAEFMYAQLVLAYAAPGDMLLCLSTSGNSANVVRAAQCANALGIATAALTGAKESKLSALCGVTVRVPETETYKVQELHLPVYHTLCAAVEKAVFG